MDQPPTHSERSRLYICWVRGRSATNRRSRKRPSRRKPSRCARRAYVCLFDFGLDAVGVEGGKAVGQNRADSLLHVAQALEAGDQDPTQRQPAVPWLAGVVVDHADKLIVENLTVGPGQHSPGG